MAMAQLVERYWTAEDVLALPEDGNRYECIDGVLLVTPAPRRLHQRACLQLFRALDAFVTTHSLGEMLFSPADVELEPGTLVQPDVFVAQDGAGKALHLWSDIERLALAIEVLSPGTARRDRGLKREFYQRTGVGEYWIVDLDARLVERWTPGSERPEILRDLLRWSPRGEDPTLEIALPGFFEAILGE
jgi:Uma2 family endonuclease